jgi:hypothetical protein
MAEAKIDKILDGIWKSTLPGGGFANRPGGQYRPDATAWAVMALQLCGVEWQRLHAARQCLAASQQEDGRVVLSPDRPALFWPTPLSVLAWHNTPEFDESRSRAVSFLLKNTGHHFKKEKDLPFGHDPAIKGWPWTEETHSWIEPTALAMIALRTTENGGSPRVAEGARLLMDRQLSKGGWNYGNTTVFDTELAAMPESTGLALAALPGLADKPDVSRSIALLKDSVKTLTTPFSLGWAILGLSAWGERPRDANALIDRCLKRQDRYGTYDTSLMGLTIVARKAEGGLIHAFS